MESSNIRNILTAFSPSLDYLALTSGDGRIKIWDTVKGQVQTEFTDIASSNSGDIFNKPERGHLSVDYTCMNWLSLDRKKKRKLGSSLLVLGTGSGDLLALDVSAGQLKWTISDCHPTGVSGISFSASDSCIYTAGADGMCCKIDPQTGNMLGKFRASTKAISSIAVSPDGWTLATAAAQLKIFTCSDHKKIQKFSGHPGAVRTMIFSEDGKYILSSAISERYVALWKIDGGKKQSACCVLAMDHPAVFLDSKCLENGGVDDSGLYILAISEIGVCYTWYGRNIEDLRNSKPTKIAVSSEEFLIQNQKGGLQTIFAAKLQGTAKPMSADVFVAYGLLVKPLFRKIVVHSGVDMKLDISQDGILLPMKSSYIKSKKGIDKHNRVTALDRANVEDASLPIPKVSDFHDRRMVVETVSTGTDEVMADVMDVRSQTISAEYRDGILDMDAPTTSMEKQLRSLQILSSKDDGTILGSIDLKANIFPKKMRAVVLSMEPSNASNLLEDLVEKWQSRSCSGKQVLPWIYCILVNHGHHIFSQDKPESQMLSSLLKITKSKGVAIPSLLQLSGRLQLVTAQIDKAALNKTPISVGDHPMDGSEDDEDDIEERLYGEDDDESQLSSDDDY